MTVAEIITKIGKINESIRLLHYIHDRYELKNGEAVAVTDAIDELEDYIEELESKIVM